MDAMSPPSSWSWLHSNHVAETSPLLKTPALRCAHVPPQPPNPPVASSPPPTMTSCKLLDLPAELSLAVVQAVAADSAADSADPPTRTPAGIIALLALAATCRTLRDTILCPENDFVWRAPAHALGIPAEVPLDAVVAAGSSSVHPRRWLSVVQTTLAWSRPFPTTRRPAPKPRRAARKLPRASAGGGGGRSVELIAAGMGSRNKTFYRVRRVDGKAVFHATSGSPDAVETTAVLDLDKPAVERVASRPAERPMFTGAQYPDRAGYVLVVEDEGESEKGEDKGEGEDADTSGKEGKRYIVQEVDGNGGFCRSWDLGPRKPSYWVSCKDMLVAATHSAPEAGIHSAPPVVRLVCALLSSPSKTSSETTTTILWEYDVAQAWATPEKPYTSCAQLRSFHLTSHTLCCLVTRHPSPSGQKLTRTDFVIISPRHSGAIVRTLSFPKHSTPASAAPAARRDLTTALAHDFLLTDTHIVSGGPGGGLRVWSLRTGLLHSLPEPFSTGTPDDDAGAAAGLARFYTAVALSADGHTIAAASSDQCALWDLSAQRLRVFSNGRRVEPRNCFVQNPKDDFPGGLWVAWRADESEDGGVVYLTDLLGEEKGGWVRAAGEGAHAGFSWVARHPWDVAWALQACVAVLLAIAGGPGWPVLALLVIGIVTGRPGRL